MSAQPTPRFKPGEKVRYTGPSNIINDQVYVGQIGSVEFHLFSSPTLVQVQIKAPGQRKNRSVAFHQDALEAA